MSLPPRIVGHQQARLPIQINPLDQTHNPVGGASRQAVIPLSPDRTRRLHVPMQELGTVGVLVRIEQVGHLAPAHLAIQTFQCYVILT